MLRVNMNENVTVHKTPEKQATVQGKLSTGRVVGQSPATARISSQMAGASSTSRQTTIHHSGAIHSGAVKRTADSPMKAVSAKRPKGAETTAHQQPWEFKKQVDDAVRKLYDERDRNKPDNLSFCLGVVNTYKMLIQHLDNVKVHWMLDTGKDCHQYVVSETSELYNENLNEILIFFQNQIAAGRGWIYTDKIDQVAKGFDKLGYKSRNITNNKALLLKLWNLLIDQEIDYLKYLKGSPDDKYSATRTLNNIHWLTSAWSPFISLGVANAERIRKIRDQTDFLHQEAICSDTDHSNAGKKKEDMLHKPVDTMMETRKNHDKIFHRLNNLNSHYNEGAKGPDYCSEPASDHERIHYLKELLELHEEHNNLVNSPATPLFQELDRLITSLTNEVQSKLEKGDYEDDQELKEEVLLLVSKLKEKWSGREHKDSCFGCMRLQSVAIPSVQENDTTFGKFNARIDHMFFILKDANNDIISMEVLKQLKQWFDDYKKERKKISHNGSNKLQSRLNSINRVLFAKLFVPILNEYQQHASNTDQEFKQRCAAMSRHKSKFIELSPYTFIFNDNRALCAWQYAAVFAWYHDLKRLGNQTSFTKDDVDDLLAMKDAAPNLLPARIENYLLLALTNLFQSMLQANPDTALIEKITKLSRWIDVIERQHNSISQILHQYNEEWRKKYVGMTSGSATTVLYAPAVMAPLSVHPGTLSASSEAFDYCSRMSLQNAPHMEQFSISCPGMPTPSPCGAFWQPASSIPCHVPIAQSATEDRPFPQPWLIGWHLPPYIPAPVYNRVDFHQPLVCGQIQPWWQATSQQPYEPGSAMPFEYRSRYPFSNSAW